LKTSFIKNGPSWHAGRLSPCRDAADAVKHLLAISYWL
jgi:hypothetical protein